MPSASKLESNTPVVRKVTKKKFKIKKQDKIKNKDNK